MPGLRNPFESYLSPRKKYTNPTEDNVSRFARINLDPWDAEEASEQDRETEPAVPRRDWSGYLRDLKNVYSQQGEAQKAYQSHLQDLPEQQNPSVWGRIVAGIVGAGTGYTEGPSKGIAAAQGIYRRPYERELEKWENKEATLGRQVEFEDKASKRQLDYLKEVGRVTENEAEYDKAMAEIERKSRMDEATIEHWKDQGWQKSVDAQGNDILVHPSGGVKMIGPSLAGRAQSEKERAAKVGEGYERQRVGQGWANVNIGQTNAATAQTNAATAQGGLAVSQRNAAVNEGRLKVEQDAEIRRAEALAKGGTARFIPPTQQTEARTAALSRAALENPDFAGYYDHKNSVVRPSVAKKYADGYKRYMQRVLEIENEMMNKRYGGLTGAPGGGGDDDEFAVGRGPGG